MKKDAIEDLVAVAEARFEQKRKCLAEINSEESEVLQALERLRLQEVKAATELLHADGLASSSAGLLWQKWAGQMRRKLNEKLVRTRAKKEQTLLSARQVFGQSYAARQLRDDHRNQTEQRRKNRSFF